MDGIRLAAVFGLAAFLVFALCAFCLTAQAQKRTEFSGYDQVKNNVRHGKDTADP